MHDFISQVDSIMPTALTGSVVRTVGMTAAVAGFPAPIGAVVEIDRTTKEPLEAEVVGFRDDLTIVFPYGDMSGIRHGNRVRLTQTSRQILVSDAMLGRVVDAHGHPIDSLPGFLSGQRLPLDREPPPATRRQPIEEPLSTGVRSIDALLSCGRGQRMGIFSGAGVGKSVMLGMMARQTSADVNVIALIGERGREVNEFLKRDLGEEGLRRSVVVVATSDQPAIFRVQAAMTATTIAEYFRDQNRNVLLQMDSLTRFAVAQREIGLSAGEPPTTRGYPPSVFALLPKLVERAGCGIEGSITAFYSVLVEGDDMNEPVSDCVRGLLDGHIILSRRLAAQGHYPAVDVLDSISRLMPELVDPEHLAAAMKVRQLLSAYRENEDMIMVGAYRQGSHPDVDAALAMNDTIREFLCQTVNSSTTFDEAKQLLLQLASQCEAARNIPVTVPENQSTLS